MSFTLMLLGRFLRRIFILGSIAGWIWINCWSFTVPIGSDEFARSALIWTLDIVMLICIGIFWWDSINQFFIKKVDPVAIKICDFINRRNGGCKEE